MANKKKFKEEKKFPLRLENDDFKDLEELVDIDGNSCVNDLMNEAIKDYIGKRESELKRRKNKNENL